LQLELLKSSNPVSYDKSLDFMQSQVSGLIEDSSNSQKIWFLEHPSLYSGGTGSEESDLLDRISFPIFKTGRGGKFTYHGPGQRVVYFMMSLKDLHDGSPDVKLFIRQIENWLVNTFKEIGINAYPSNENIGIWTKNTHGTEGKLAAIGVRIKKWMVFHGVAININPNLSHYSGIVPCGIRDKAVTSLWNEGIEMDIAKLDDILLSNFKKTFNCDIAKTTNLEL
jgi:lipoyl(octanoyl) transferase